MQVIKYALIILYSIGCFASFIDMFAKETVKERLMNFASTIIFILTIYLLWC